MIITDVIYQIVHALIVTVLKVADFQNQGFCSCFFPVAYKHAKSLRMHNH